jgi:hypothetical protein
MKPRRVGILGGMGPEATVLLMSRLIEATPAADDSDHVPLIVDQNPQVPSRIARLLEGRGADPAPVLADMARRLEATGAEALAMPCNTAHYYAPAIRAAVGIPLIDMIGLRWTLPPHGRGLGRAWASWRHPLCGGLAFSMHSWRGAGWWLLRRRRRLPARRNPVDQVQAGRALRLGARSRPPRPGSWRAAPRSSSSLAPSSRSLPTRSLGGSWGSTRWIASWTESSTLPVPR